jgi:hypothetical protein
MRKLIFLHLVVISVSCGALEQPRTRKQDVDATTSFRERCIYFESMNFGEMRSSNLRGKTLFSDQGATEPLERVQVAARGIQSGLVWYVFSEKDGGFAIDTLPADEYEVWTCLDGFDELRFRLIVDPSSHVDQFELYLGPSEAAGRREVIPLE